MPWFNNRKTKSGAKGSTAAVGVGLFCDRWVVDLGCLGFKQIMQSLDNIGSGFTYRERKIFQGFIFLALTAQVW